MPIDMMGKDFNHPEGFGAGESLTMLALAVRVAT